MYRGAHGVTGYTTGSPDMAGVAYPAMKIFGYWLVLPVALVSLVSGLVLSLGTAWGLARHRWVHVKFWLTLITVLLSVFSLRPGFNDLAAEAAAGTPPPDINPVVAPAVATATYLLVTAISVLKHRRLTGTGGASSGKADLRCRLGDDPVVLLGGTAAEAEGTDQPAVPVERHTAREEEQRPVQRRGQGVEEPVGPYELDQVSGRGVQLQCRVRLAGAGLPRDQYGRVVPPEAEQMTARIQNADAAPHPEAFGGTNGGVDEALGIAGGERADGGDGRNRRNRGGGTHEDSSLGAWRCWGCVLRWWVLVGPVRPVRR